MRQRNRNEREQEGEVLSGDFINDHELRIFDSRVGGCPGSAPHPNRPQQDEERQSTKHRQRQDGVVNVAARDKKVLTGKHRVGIGVQREQSAEGGGPQEKNRREVSSRYSHE